MRIAVLREVKQCEYRAALLPEHVHHLTALGHELAVETGAGEACGYGDALYREAGAQVADKAAVLRGAGLVMKVKAPLRHEFGDYHAGQILFTFLHFDENIPADDIRDLVASGVTGIAYEWVGGDGHYPILLPMSRLTGYLFAQKAVELATARRRFLCGRYEPWLRGGKALIIGLGTIGASVYNFCRRNGILMTIMDKNPATVAERLEHRFPGTGCFAPELTELVRFSNEEPGQAVTWLARELPGFDLVFNCAVRRPDLPKSRLDYLITETMVRTMAPGAVLCDTTACDRDLIETAVSSPDLDHCDVIHGVVHYNPDHIPSLVARSSSKLLADAALPFTERLAAFGIDALAEDPQLKNGVSCHAGHVTFRYAAEKKNLPWRELDDLL